MRACPTATRRVATGALTMLSASRCSGVHTTCIRGGDTSCATALAVDSSLLCPLATRALERAFGRKNAPPTVSASRVAKSP